MPNDHIVNEIVVIQAFEQENENANVRSDGGMVRS